jgi:hypothetical protein
MRTKVLAGLWLLAATACVSVNKSILAPNPTGRTFGLEQVYVYFPDDSIPDHTRLAILNAKGDADATDEGEMIDKLREEAGKLGANAIVLGELEEPGLGAIISDAFFGTTANRETQAIAIYVPSRDAER